MHILSNVHMFAITEHGLGNAFKTNSQNDKLFSSQHQKLTVNRVARDK